MPAQFLLLLLCRRNRIMSISSPRKTLSLLTFIFFVFVSTRARAGTTADRERIRRRGVDCRDGERGGGGENGLFPSSPSVEEEEENFSVNPGWEFRPPPPPAAIPPPASEGLHPPQSPEKGRERGKGGGERESIAAAAASVSSSATDGDGDVGDGGGGLLLSLRGREKEREREYIDPSPPPTEEHCNAKKKWREIEVAASSL